MTVLVIVAHPDDSVLGCGGTIAKISAKEDVHTIIVSGGDKWPPWKEPEEITRERKKEARNAGKVLGTKSTDFLDIPDGKILSHKEDAKEKIKKTILEHMPKRIFTHSMDDAHPDHTAVNKIVTESIKELEMKIEIFLFDITSLTNIFTKGEIKIIFDITNTYEKKKMALEEFKSQWLLLAPLVPWLKLKSKIMGRGQGFKYSEYFYLK